MGDSWTNTLSAIKVLHQQHGAILPLLQTINSLQNNLLKTDNADQALVRGMVNSLASLYCNVRVRAEAEILLADEALVHVRALLHPARVEDIWHGQLPITVGRPVAMRQSLSEHVYVLTRVKQCLNEREYEVEDVDGSLLYRITIDRLLPLPWADAPPGHAQHFPVEYKTGSRVLAVYPSTTTFYPATILETPKQMAATARKAHMAMGTVSKSYRLHFDADDVPNRLVPVQHVILAQPRD